MSEIELIFQRFLAVGKLGEDIVVPPVLGFEQDKCWLIAYFGENLSSKSCLRIWKKANILFLPFHEEFTYCFARFQERQPLAEMVRQERLEGAVWAETYRHRIVHSWLILAQFVERNHVKMLSNFR